LTCQPTSSAKASHRAPRPIYQQPICETSLNQAHFTPFSFPFFPAGQRPIFSRPLWTFGLKPDTYAQSTQIKNHAVGVGWKIIVGRRRRIETISN
jgi:hypothetical protein